MTPGGMTGDPGGLRVDSAPLAGIADGIRIHLAGKSTGTSVLQLQSAIDGHLDAGRKKLLIDCERLEYLNSTALGYFINMSDRMEKSSGAVAFIRVPPKVRQVFTLLGLQNFFPVFDSEREAFAHFSTGPAAAPPPPPAPPRPAPKVVIPPAVPPRPAPAVVIPPAAPPRPAAPEGLPISHPRWTVLLQTVVERGGAGVLRELCARQKISGDGEPLEVVRRLIRAAESPEELLGLLDDATLTGLGTLYQVSSGGARAERIAALVSFVQRTSTAFLSGILSATRVMPRLEPGMLPVDLTKENLVLTLEKTPLPRRVKSEAAAKKLVLERLLKVFGKERVARKRKGAGTTVHSVEVELGGEFGVEIRLGRALLRPSGGSLKEVQRLLGQLVADGKRYGPERVVAVIVGDVTRDQGASLGEVRELVQSLGSHLVHLR